LIERSGNRLANEPALGKSVGINWNLRDNNGINLFHDLRVCGKPDIRITTTEAGLTAGRSACAVKASHPDPKTKAPLSSQRQDRFKNFKRRRTGVFF
jgi:hypothetical protein